MLRLALLPAALLLIAAGCKTTEPLSNDPGGTTGPMTDMGFAELREPFTLEQGASTVVDGMVVRFDAITEDSRCPDDPGTSCVWEGRATISLSLIADDTMSNVQLSIPGFVSADSEPQEIQSAEAAGYTLTLLQLDPYPGHEGADAGMAPVATLKVTTGG